MNAATSTVGASSSSPAILDEMMEELSSTIVATTTNAATATASDIRLCSHGCRSNHFQDGVAYKDVIPDCVSASKDLELRVKFAMDHMDYFSDLNFSQYIFALCTSWYLKTNQTPFEMRELLEEAMEIKYANMSILHYLLHLRSKAVVDNRNPMTIKSNDIDANS